MASIICGRNRSHRHSSVDEVRVCYRMDHPSVRVAPAYTRTRVPLELLDSIPDGYYAVQPDTETPFTFLKVLRPKRGNYKGCFKVSTQHGPAWKEAFVYYPTGRLWRSLDTVEESILLVMSDYRWAARNYAREIGKCCRCNTALTDERSRHYGIGPECEQHWPWMLVAVNEENNDLSYEELKARGEI